jgi:CDP-diacylglycerol--serine O-phosphatidyltransferase
MKHIPNFITSLNLVSGFIAVIFAARGDIIIASWLIVAAMIFDFFDGFTARLLKSYSDLGKELDSLADVVSFGVAPAIIIFHFLSNALSPDAMILVTENIGYSILLFLPAVMPVCAAFRLAKFNLDPEQSTDFRGLPTPANAIAVVSVVLAFNTSSSPLLNSFVNSPVWLTLFTFTLSLLMVSRIPLFSLKIKNFEFRGNEGRYILVVLILISLLLFGMSSLPMIIPFYIAASVVHYRIIRRA